jgi:hypothetical protein
MINIKRINAYIIIIIAISSSNLTRTIDPITIFGVTIAAEHVAAGAAATFAGAGGFVIGRASLGETPEQKAKNAQFEEQAAQARLNTTELTTQSELKKAQGKLDVLEIAKKENDLRSSEEFKKCLLSNYNPNISKKIPSACSNFARALAVMAGQTKVDEVISDFNKYSGS